MKAEELAREWFANPPSASNWVEPLATLLRSYGLACAMKEREANAKVAETTYAKTAFHYELGTAVAQHIRSRPVGDELMKEIEG